MPPPAGLAPLACLIAVLCLRNEQPVGAGERQTTATNLRREFESGALGASITLRAPPVLTVGVSEQIFLAIHVQGENVKNPIALSFSGLPVGVNIAPAATGAGTQKTWRGVLTANTQAQAGTATIKIHARSGQIRAEAAFELLVIRKRVTAVQSKNLPAIRSETPARNESGFTLSGAQGMLREGKRGALGIPMAVDAALTVPESEIFPVLPTEQSSKTAVTPAAVSSSPDRWLLMKALQGTWLGTALYTERLSVSGWTEASFTASSVHDNQLPMGFNYLANQFALQQNWLRIERLVVTSDTSAPSFGFRSDTILPGTDYRFTTARGLFSSQLTANNGQPNAYGIDPVQFYGEAYFPTLGRGLDVKFGRTYTQFGAEAIDAPSNLLTSHSYTFIYSPFTNTGIFGTLQLTPTWSFQLGIVMGPDVFIDAASSPYALFSAKWTPPGGRDTVQFAGLLGSGRFNVPEQFNNPNILDLVYVHTFNARLTYTLDSIVGYQTNIPDIGTAPWFTAANYLTYKLTPRLSANSRLEFFNDIEGSRTGFKGLYTALTTGLNFQLHKDIVFRPEIRYDYNDETRPFQGHHGVLTAATDVIVRW